MKKDELHKRSIEKLQSDDWKIIFDSSNREAKIVSNKGEELDIITLNFVMEHLGNYLKRREEKEIKESRKTPIDEFTRKRLGILDYVLVKDEIRNNLREIFEVYHDTNGIFTMDKYIVDLSNNLKYYDFGFEVYLNVWEAEKILESLLKFIQRNRS